MPVISSRHAETKADQPTLKKLPGPPLPRLAEPLRRAAARIASPDDLQGFRPRGHALAVADDLGRRLHVVHVVDIGDYLSDIDAADWDERSQQELAAQRDRVERTLADTGLSWTYEARRGDPTVELARAAEEHEALLIVVGTRGEGLRVVIPRLIEPSVSHGVIHCQNRPVLVVPASNSATAACGSDAGALFPTEPGPDQYGGPRTATDRLQHSEAAWGARPSPRADRQ